jgi:hypothetical protein
VVISLIEGAVVVGSITALGAALFNYGVPNDSAIKYEAAVKANGFLVLLCHKIYLQQSDTW